MNKLAMDQIKIEIFLLNMFLAYLKKSALIIILRKRLQFFIEVINFCLV